MPKGTILGALKAIGASVEDVQGCETIEVEFRNLKKVYFKRILASHPDKGGDPNVFRDVQAAWEVVRELYDKGKVNPAGFPYYFSGQGAKQAAAAPTTDYSAGPRPSYEYYEAAAQEDVPSYRMERAKSNRSVCKAVMGALGTRHGLAAGAPPQPKPAKAAGKSKGKGKKGKGKAEDAEEERDESRALVDMSSAVIEKDTIRFGSMDLEAGAYGRWRHLQCTRIPSSIWLGLPPEGCTDPALFRAALERMNHVVLSGFSELDEEGKAEVVEYFMNRENYARLTKKSAPAVPYNPSASVPAPATSAAAGAGASAGPASGVPTGYPSSTSSSSSASAAAAPAPSQALTVPRPVQGNVFVVPRPGLNGAAAGALNGKTFVLTGVFPEVGGGAGLNLGKDRVEAMIAAFGGRVTGSVSGKTSALVVGKAPGAVKVNAAREKEIPLLDVQGLKALLEGGGSGSSGGVVKLEDAPAAVITSYSSGYMGNGHGALLGDKYIPPAKPASTALLPAPAAYTMPSTTTATTSAWAHTHAPTAAPAPTPAPAPAPAAATAVVVGRKPAPAPTPAPAPAPAAAMAVVVGRKPAAKRRKRAAVDWDDDEDYKYKTGKKRVFKELGK